MVDVIKYEKLSFDKLTFSKPEKQNNIYFSSISLDGKPVYIQTNKLKYMNVNDDKNSSRKFMCVSTFDKDFSLYDKLLKLDDYILNTTFSNSKEWFNKDISLDIFENQYKRITQPFEKGTNPNLNLRIPIIRNKVQCNLYDQSNNLIDMEKISENDNLLCILHIKGIKFLKEIFYVDLYINQVKLCKSVQYLIPSKCLIEDDSETYDYEILDEEYILKETEKRKLEEQSKALHEKINHYSSELSDLNKKIKDLTL